ncbi:PhoX family protein [Kineobactrum salinum]|uniref:PhoX family phosphatase n=1 Tax=Kineobactrum salinum TaxID=2708301 RepID=A0A6C0U0I1_9GAMM|nr:PhoX family phosphatase [Kineobactrum salinum]QIB65293.1 PhoX family phosphatase [Kineobactrum salinum]
MSDRPLPGYADAAFVASEEPRHSPLGQPDLQRVASARYGRRDLLRGGLALAVASLFGAPLPRLALARDPSAGPGLLGFAPVPVSRADTAVVPSGYRLQVLLPWGEPITGDYPAFAPDNNAAQQALQMGMHHDGMHFFPLQGSGDGLLVLNHEYAEPRLMHAAAAGLPLGAFDVPLRADGSRDPEQVYKEMNAHGVSVVRIQRGADGQWGAVRDARNRRITALTPMEFRGPLRGDPRLETPYSPEGLMTRGTLNNCSHGVTPWGTYLTCEENWHFYFVREGDGAPASQSRYSVGPQSAWRWHLAAAEAGKRDEACARFDATPRAASALQDYRNEPHAFGWVVEVDPFDPDSTPVKRTHLGRFSHEGVVFAPVEEGRPLVLYSGDDSAFEYIYKFVSARPWHRATADGSLLDEGTLYAARFADDGSGEWLALVPGQNGLGAQSGFATLADVLLNARGAADVAGATPLDRPEWGAVDPGTGAVYFTLTNNKRRREEQVDAVNPRPANHFGQIVRWREADDDHTALTFDWELFLLAGDTDNSRDLQGNALDEDNLLAMPDGLWFDADRRLWIQTDISDRDQNKDPYRPMGNNAMLAADPDTGELRRFFTGPVGAEITGCVTTPDQRAMFINVQHPGATTSAADFARGQLDSHWPEGGGAVPRSATLVITREDGGKIGS